MDHTEKMVGMAHPNGQVLTEVTMAQLAAGAAPPIAPGRSFREDELKQRFSLHRHRNRGGGGGGGHRGHVPPNVS